WAAASREPVRGRVRAGPHDHPEPRAVRDKPRALPARAGRGCRGRGLAPGRRRVCYLQLGHDMRAWDDPFVRTLITRVALWAVAGASTDRASTDRESTDGASTDRESTEKEAVAV